jgi:hypothetical protein
LKIPTNEDQQLKIPKELKGSQRIFTKQQSKIPEAQKKSKDLQHSVVQLYQNFSRRNEIVDQLETHKPQHRIKASISRRQHLRNRFRLRITIISVVVKKKLKVLSLSAKWICVR